MDLLLNPPKSIDTTVEEFLRFSGYELASFFVNWKVCWQRIDGAIKIWTGNYELATACADNYRFTNQSWFEVPKYEIYYCKVTDDKLIKLIESRFPELMLK